MDKELEQSHIMMDGGITDVIGSRENMNDVDRQLEAIRKKGKLYKLLIKIRNYFLDFDDEGGVKKFKFSSVFNVAALMSFALIIPSLIMNLIFDWFPMFDGIKNSVYSWTTGTEPIFVGLGNFKRVLTDSLFYRSFGNMMFFFIANIILLVPTIICSVILFRLRSEKAQYTYRVLLCLQMVVPGIVVTLMWFFLLNSSYGSINQLLQSLGFDKVAFLSDPKLIKWTIILVAIPFISANDTLIYLGGLNSIDEAVWEASTLDGVGPIGRLFYLEFPLILGQFKLILMGMLSASIVGYGTQLLYYNSAVHESIMIPGLLMYMKAFPQQGNPDYGYSFALGLILFVISLTLSLVTLKFFKSKND